MRKIRRQGGYLQKFQAIVREVFFANYVNSVGSNIDGSDLICAPYTPRCHMHLICSLFGDETFPLHVPMHVLYGDVFFYS
jgi:hypothetical protein